MKILFIILLSLMFLSCASAEYDKYIELDSKCSAEYISLNNNGLCRSDGLAYLILYDPRHGVVTPRGMPIKGDSLLRLKAELKERATEFASVCKPWLDWIASDQSRRRNDWGRAVECSRGLVKAMEKGKEKEKQDSIKEKQDSIENENLALAKKKSYDEINSLIENNVEIDLILDKCREHLTKFNELLQECKSIVNSVRIDKITKLLKADELEECFYECQRIDLRDASSDFSEKISDLCKEQLPSKIKKIPLNKINTEKLAEMYFSPFYESTSFVFEQIPKNSNVQIQGRILQNEGKRAILELTRDYDFIVKHSGQCLMREGAYLNGYGIYLGEETYTTVMGAKRTLPAFQLLWCPQ